MQRFDANFLFISANGCHVSEHLSHSRAATMTWATGMDAEFQSLAVRVARSHGQYTIVVLFMVTELLPLLPL